MNPPQIPIPPQGDLRQIMADYPELFPEGDKPLGVLFSPGDRQTPKPLDTGRLTTLYTVYYQHPNGQQLEVTNRTTTSLAVEEQPFKRLMKAPTEWRPLNYGWLGEQVSFLMLQNTSKPTVEGKETPNEVTGVALELAMEHKVTDGDGKRTMHSRATTVHVPFTRILPGEALPLRPLPGLCIRAMLPISIVLTAFPE